MVSAKGSLAQEPKDLISRLDPAADQQGVLGNVLCISEYLFKVEKMETHRLGKSIQVTDLYWEDRKYKLVSGCLKGVA